MYWFKRTWIFLNLILAEPEFIVRTSAELRTLEDWYRFKADQLDEGMQRVAELTYARLSEWSEDETDTDETV